MVQAFLNLIAVVLEDAPNVRRGLKAREGAVVKRGVVHGIPALRRRRQPIYVGTSQISAALAALGVHLGRNAWDIAKELRRARQPSAVAIMTPEQAIAQCYGDDD